MKKIDLHLHSDLSSDGKVSFEKIVRKLKEENVQTAALTNHIPEVPGHLWYASCNAVVNLKKERDKLEDTYGVRILVGAEIDVIDVSGRLAAPESLIDEFEFIISGVHRYPNATRGAGFMVPVCQCPMRTACITVQLNIMPSQKAFSRTSRSRSLRILCSPTISFFRRIKRPRQSGHFQKYTSVKSCASRPRRERRLN